MQCMTPGVVCCQHNSCQGVLNHLPKVQSHGPARLLQCVMCIHVHTVSDAQEEVPKVQTAVDSTVGAGPFLTEYQQQVSTRGSTQDQKQQDQKQRTLCKPCCGSSFRLQQ